MHIEIVAEISCSKISRAPCFHVRSSNLACFIRGDSFCNRMNIVGKGKLVIMKAGRIPTICFCVFVPARRNN